VQQEMTSLLAAGDIMQLMGIRRLHRLFKWWWRRSDARSLYDITAGSSPAGGSV